MTGMTQTMVMGGLHAQTGMELQRLKGHIEGKFVPPFPTDTPSKP